MHDFEDPVWAEHHGQWAATLAAALRRLAGDLARHQHRRFTAPWRAEATCEGGRT